jgi:hypothetical protein
MLAENERQTKRQRQTDKEVMSHVSFAFKCSCNILSSSSLLSLSSSLTAVMPFLSTMLNALDFLHNLMNTNKNVECCRSSMQFKRTRQGPYVQHHECFVATVYSLFQDRSLQSQLQSVTQHQRKQ